MIYIYILSFSSLIAHKIIKITLWSKKKKKKKKKKKPVFQFHLLPTQFLVYPFFSYILGAKSYI